MQDETAIALERDFYGYAGAGPITVSLWHDDAGEPEGVHLSWGDEGMFLAPHQARALARFLVTAAREVAR
jgi:hypothetical protein